jgi:hypothetical protein
LGLVLTIGLVLGVGMMFGIAGCPTTQPGPGPEPECEDNTDCDDGLFCNGAETCVDEECVAGEDPCDEGQECDETNDVCLTPCANDDDCDDGNPCTVDACVTADPDSEGGTCVYTDVECDEGQECDPETGECVASEPAACESDAECDDGEFCNGAETCVEGECQAGTAACAGDQVCDEETDSCAPAPAGEAFAESNVLFDDFERVHGLHQASAAVSCTDCHHDEPVAAGFDSCFDCHSDDPAEFNSLKSVAHDSDGDDNGCRACHNQTTEEGSWDCSFCHTAPFE